MKKIFLIFTVLFTSISPMAGFGDFITSSNQEFASFKNEQQNDFMNFKSRIQQKSLDFQEKNHQEFDDFQARSQQEINNLRNKSDNKIAEIKRKSAEAFEKLEKKYNDFIQGTPFVNCIPGWSFLECKQDEPAWWSCNLKPGITRGQMQSDVEAYCTQKSDAFEYDPLDNFEEPENEENDTPIRMTAQVEKLSSEDEVNSHAEHNENTDFNFMAAQKQEQKTKDWNTNYNDSDETPASTPAPTPNKSASAMIAQDATRKAEKNKKNCTPAQRNKINATDCKISADGKYSDIVCKAGYTKNTDGTKCEKSDTPDKKAKPELIKISGIVIDATVNDRNLQELCEKDKKGTWIKTSGKCNCKDKTAIFDETKGCVPPKNLQRGGNVIDEKGNPMPNVTIKYGNKKIQTDKDGRFDITAPKGTVVTLSAKGYEDIKITLDEDCPNCDIDMTPTEKSANNAKKKELCEKDGPNQGKWNETLKTCKCKGKAFFDEDEGCVESTQEYIDAEQALNNLYEQFTTQLEQIKNTNTQ